MKRKRKKENEEKEKKKEKEKSAVIPFIPVEPSLAQTNGKLHMVMKECSQTPIVFTLCVSLCVWMR